MLNCSSRFTDSKKYEEDFLECFQLSTPRQGEICNACVLLVKRWKKLPAGSDRNWRHVSFPFTFYRCINVKKHTLIVTVHKGVIQAKGWVGRCTIPLIK